MSAPWVESHMSPHQVFEPAVSAGLLPRAKISGHFIMVLSGVFYHVGTTRPSICKVREQEAPAAGLFWPWQLPVRWLGRIPNQMCL